MGQLTLRLEGEAPLTPGMNIFVTPRESEPASFRQGRQADRLTAGERRTRQLQVWLDEWVRIMSVKLSAAALARLPAGVAAAELSAL